MSDKLPASLRMDRIDRMRPMGKTGLKEYSGYIYEEFLRSLDGALGVKVYKEMANNHAVIGAVIFVVESLLSSAAFNIEAADSSPEEQEKANFVSECLNDMEHSWEEFVRTVARGLITYGWAVHEKVFKRRMGLDSEDRRFRSKYSDGRIGWREWAPRSQDTLLHWVMDEEGQQAVGMVQLPPQGGQTITLPLTRCLHFKTDYSKYNPEGRSLLRNAYVSWFYQKRLIEIESIGVERDLAGLPMLKIPMLYMGSSATTEQKQFYEECKAIVTRTKNDEQMGLVLPSDRDEKGNLLFEFTLLGQGGGRRIDTNPLIERYDRRIAMTMLADFIMLGHEAVGSFALSSSKTGMFARAVGSILGMIAAEINKAIPELLKLNGFDTTKVPTGSFADLETPDLQELANYIATMVGAGVLQPDELLEAFVRDAASLPALDEDAIREAGEEKTEAEEPNGGTEQRAEGEDGQAVEGEPEAEDQEQPNAG